MMLEHFVEITGAAASSAARALSRMARRPAVVKMMNARLVQLPAERPELDLEGLVSGVYLPISGGLRGAALLCFAEPRALALVDMVIGTPRALGRAPELDTSALKELGNIICGNYVNEISNRLGLKISPGLPQVARGSFAEICGRVLALHDLDARPAVVLDVELNLPPGNAMGHLLLCFETVQGLEA